MCHLKKSKFKNNKGKVDLYIYIYITKKLIELILFLVALKSILKYLTKFENLYLIY